jgi:hypothetical protein
MLGLGVTGAPAGVTVTSVDAGVDGTVIDGGDDHLTSSVADDLEVTGNVGRGIGASNKSIVLTDSITTGNSHGRGGRDTISAATGRTWSWADPAATSWWVARAGTGATATRAATSAPRPAPGAADR